MQHSSSPFARAAWIICMLAATTALDPDVATGQPAADTVVVAARDIDDFKAIFATVDSKDRVEARVRTPGTVTQLKVEDGAQVETGQVLAVIADPKIALRISALDAQIAGLQSRTETAKADLDRRHTPRQCSLCTATSASCDAMHE